MVALKRTIDQKVPFQCFSTYKGFLFPKVFIYPLHYRRYKNIAGDSWKDVPTLAIKLLIHGNIVSFWRQYHTEKFRQIQIHACRQFFWWYLSQMDWRAPVWCGTNKNLDSYLNRASTEVSARWSAKYLEFSDSIMNKRRILITTITWVRKTL